MVKFIAKPEHAYTDAIANLSRISCTKPFRNLEIHDQGNVSLCCHTWLPEWCGNLLTDSIDQIMANAKKLEIEQDMREGKFHHCNDLCPYISSYISNGYLDNHNYFLVPKQDIDQHLARESYQVYFNYDKSCNLQCPSCRTELMLYRPDDPSDSIAAHLMSIHQKVKQLVQALLDRGHTVQLSITGSGDPFASPIYWNYLKELATGPINSKLRIGFQTNGVMMTAARWAEIRPLWPLINTINVSIDAATDCTYKIVRKGGNFVKLVANLDHLDAMIAQGDLPIMENWQNNFIVQRDNFRELKQFVEWQLSYKTLKVIWTNLIAQWVHMTDDEYADMAVWQDGHELRSELVTMLQDPIFNETRVNLGNLSSLLDR